MVWSVKMMWKREFTDVITKFASFHLLGKLLNGVWASVTNKANL